jgi:hypothetical protein
MKLISSSSWGLNSFLSKQIAENKTSRRLKTGEGIGIWLMTLETYKLIADPLITLSLLKIQEALLLQ